MLARCRGSYRPRGSRNYDETAACYEPGRQIDTLLGRFGRSPISGLRSRQSVSVEFSTIIPTCRRPAELAEAITSVLAQSDVTLEIFVVDDSLDGSAKEVAAAFRDRRVVYMENPHPTGGVPGVVRNLAWPYPRGTFVHFLDDDDMVPRGHYSAVKASFSQHPEVGVVFGHIEPFGNGPE